MADREETAAAAARRLDEAGTQVEALTRFLEECRRHASRAALLVLRRSRLEVWRSTGFATGPGERKPGGLAIEGNGALGRVREGVPLSLRRGNEVSASLGAADAQIAVLVPFVVCEKVSGAVYADAAGEHGRLDADAVALLTWIAGLVVDRLARRKLVPSPALRPFDGGQGSPVFEEAPPPAAVPLDAEAAGDARAPGGPLAPPAEYERRDEARRFARLLACEIKLYNEHEVAEGRQRGDLYARLKDDIERGRRVYEERVPADVRSAADYYYEELVDVLADGRPEALQ